MHNVYIPLVLFLSILSSVQVVGMSIHTSIHSAGFCWLWHGILHCSHPSPSEWCWQLVTWALQLLTKWCKLCSYFLHTRISTLQVQSLTYWECRKVSFVSDKNYIYLQKFTGTHNRIESVNMYTWLHTSTTSHSVNMDTWLHPSTKSHSYNQNINYRGYSR